ncbi:uncharacterized protein LOC104865683 isoform X2 [Fukomys damarensis]|uniref:uncharacterized protein LOC104865683 isoform X2 n=1 Tax=Fukomys damarensis TaxID=885580 RepID=UPI00053F7B47|nr:uncharacterized protein LOC104865683 isoform X2 [Fukomys damarensis]
MATEPRSRKPHRWERDRGPRPWVTAPQSRQPSEDSLDRETEGSYWYQQASNSQLNCQAPPPGAIPVGPQGRDPGAAAAWLRATPVSHPGSAPKNQALSRNELIRTSATRFPQQLPHPRLEGRDPLGAPGHAEPPQLPDTGAPTTANHETWAQDNGQ